MIRLNKLASELAMAAGVRGATDVTGYSLLGHGLEMAQASGIRLRFSLAKIPFTRGARKYAEQWTFPGGTSDNRLYYGSQVAFDPGIDEAWQMLLFDAQTSGGLLCAVSPDRLAGLLERAEEADQPLWVIGEVLTGAGIQVVE
jgi:selenide,water dikinase